MTIQKIDLSIIIVHYKVKKEIIDCINSIKKSKTKYKYEIIVVDNDSNKSLGNILKTNFKKVIYIANHKNDGFGAGNNIGAKNAKGKILFFLNPDTIIFPDTIENLLDYINKHKNIGAASPLLLDKNSTPYELQGAKELNPLKMVLMSFLDPVLPNNPIKNSYWNLNWSKEEPKEFETIPGSAIMIRKNIFDQIGGFDEKFFLFFEEHDLCKRISELGYKAIILPSSKVIHLWGKSVDKLSDNLFFEKSREYYLKKHYGLSISIFAIFLLRGYFISFALISLGAFLLFYNIISHMPFIGDQAWFYISARDMLLSGNIPLVGITSSHTWLHQGPFWTYILSAIFLVTKYNPIAPAYFTSFMGVVILVSLYYVTGKIFGKRTAVLSILLYSVSFTAVFATRMPYHTTLIPFFTIWIFFALYNTVQNKKKWLVIVPLILGILYNFEIATTVLIPIFVGIILWGKYMKMDFIKMKASTVLTSLLLFLAVMLPMIIYDTTHGFPQTIKFAAWVPYRIFKLLSNHSTNLSNFSAMNTFYLDKVGSLISSPLPSLGLLLIFASFLFLMVKIKNDFKPNKYSLLLLFTVFPLVVFYFNMTPSDAYLPIIFPTTIISTSLFLSRLSKSKGKVIIFCLIFILYTSNFWYLLSVLNTKNNFSLERRIEVSKELVFLAKGKEFNLIGIGEGSQFESFTMNTEYLSWWLGGKPTKVDGNLKFIVEETKSGINLKEPK